MKQTKEVWFDQYCKTCKYCTLKDCEDPCNGCLDYPGNEDSHKPVNWREKDE